MTVAKGDLVALDDLRRLPQLKLMNGAVPDLELWVTKAERDSFRRAQRESIAMAGMSVAELHLFFYRAGYDACKSWVSEQSRLGRLKNRLTIKHVGYAQVHGRVLLQAMRRLNQPSADVIEPSATYLLRADTACEIRDILKTQLESAA